MTPTERGGFRRLATAVGIGGGLLMITVALLADRLGLDHSPSFGTGETLLLVAGLCVLTVAILGRRTGDARRHLAVFVFDAVVLLLLVELALIGWSTWANTSWRSPAESVGLVDRLHRFYLDLPYYQDQPWAETYWRENAEAGARQYRPFVTWRRGPYAGETVTIDANGYRQVPGTRCDHVPGTRLDHVPGTDSDPPDHVPGTDSDQVPGTFRVGTFRVDMLGGSTMWGWGAPDDGTIPALLQRRLEALLDRPVCVRNLGETAYVASQEMVQWSLTLRDDHAAGRPRPDLAIFYDGVNDTLAAHQAGHAGSHQNLAQVAGRLETSRRPLAEALGRLEVVQLARRWLPTPDPPEAAKPEDLAMQVVVNYLGVVETASHLGGDTPVVFFWQPMLGVGDKPLDDDERALVEGALDWAQDPNPAPLDFFRQVYDQAARIGDPRVVDLRDAFDRTTESVWIDPWGHVTPVGNAIVADRMIEALLAKGLLPVAEAPDD